MKSIGQPVFVFVVGLERLVIANPAFPDWNDLGETYNQQANPAHQYESEESARLDEWVELVTGIVYGIEVIVNAVQLVIHSLESDVIEHEVVRVISQDGGSWYYIAVLWSQMYWSGGIVTSNKHSANRAPQKWTKEHEYVQGHEENSFENKFEASEFRSHGGDNLLHLLLLNDLLGFKLFKLVFGNRLCPEQLFIWGLFILQPVLTITLRLSWWNALLPRSQLYHLLRRRLLDLLHLLD